MIPKPIEFAGKIRDYLEAIRDQLVAHEAWIENDRERTVASLEALDSKIAALQLGVPSVSPEAYRHDDHEARLLALENAAGLRPPHVIPESVPSVSDAIANAEPPRVPIAVAFYDDTRTLYAVAFPLAFSTPSNLAIASRALRDGGARIVYAGDVIPDEHAPHVGFDARTTAGFCRTVYRDALDRTWRAV